MQRTPPIAASLEVKTDEAAEAPPDGCMSAIDRERQLTSLAIYAEKVGRDLCTGDNANIPMAVKMFDVAIKAHRAAGENTVVRERRNYVARLERTVARLRGGRN